MNCGIAGPDFDDSRALSGERLDLTYVAKRHRAEFTGLDYSDAGCRLLEQRARSEGLKVGVIHADLFDLTPEVQGWFDWCTASASPSISATCRRSFARRRSCSRQAGEC